MRTTNNVIKNPKVQVWLWLIVCFVLIAFALFLSAGTFNYWQAWIYLAVGALSSVPLTLYITKDPILLENRTKAGPSAERRPIQKIIVLVRGAPGYRNVHRSRARSPFRLVERAVLAFHCRRPLNYRCNVDSLPRIQRELFRLRHGRDRQGSKGNLHRSLRHRAKSDVF